MKNKKAATSLSNKMMKEVSKQVGELFKMSEKMSEAEQFKFENWCANMKEVFR